jgi:hypothetical protein
MNFRELPYSKEKQQISLLDERDLFSKEPKPLFEENSSYLKETSPYLKENLLPIFNEAFEKDLSERPNWSVEANVILLPIFSFERRSNNTNDGAILLSSLPDVRDGKVITRKILISTGKREKDGKVVNDSRPGAFDMSVLFCILDLWDEQQRPENGVVKFTLNQLCTRLKLTDAGKNFEHLKASILRLKRTTIESINAFYSKESANYLTVSTNLFDDATIVTSAGRGRAGLCEVKIGRHILANLSKNFTAKINRQIYQQLEIPFSKRLLALVIYEQQIRHEVGVIDFELMHLAELLPMQGKVYPSNVKSRLSAALSELKEKRVFDHEYIKVDKKWVLRLIPYDQPERYLVGVENLDLFISMIEIVYKKKIDVLLGLDRSNLKEIVERFNETIDFRKRKYTWAYHVISVFCHMISNGYKAQDPVRLLKVLLTKKEHDLDVPLDFSPIDVQYKKLLQEASLKRAISEREEQMEAAEEMSRSYAEEYLAKLSREELEEYLKRAREQNPMFSSFTIDSPLMRASIIQMIHEDVKNGRQFYFGKSLNIQSSPYLIEQDRDQSK